MSETASTARKPAQAARESAHQVRDAAHTAAEASMNSTREAANRTEDVFNRTAEEARDIGVSVADTMARGADAAVDITERVAEQGREVIWLGVRAAAGVNGRLADVGYGRSHRVVGELARSLDIYRQAGETAADNVQALFASWTSLGRGMQEMQRAWLEMLDRATDHGTRKPQDLLRCKSMPEMAEIQRDLWLDSVNHAIETSSTLLRIAGRATQDAMRPLQGRAQMPRA
ncbi:MAG TPA: phasin family protein [Acetobacteraceae bacterium]|nr:phasin family protein [Acetobacteraceae bacterium]